MTGRFSIKSIIVPCDPLHIPLSISIFAVHITKEPTFNTNTFSPLLFVRNLLTAISFCTGVKNLPLVNNSDSIVLPERIYLSISYSIAITHSCSSVAKSLNLSAFILFTRDLIGDNCVIPSGLAICIRSLSILIFFADIVPSLT